MDVQKIAADNHLDKGISLGNLSSGSIKILVLSNFSIPVISLILSNSLVEVNGVT